MEKSVNKTALIKEISKSTGVSLKDVQNVINSFISTIYLHLSNGETVQIQELGTFKKVHYKKRGAFNIRARKKMTIPAQDLVRFKISTKLRKLYKERG